MADQTIRYRVELDDADLAQQLEGIRSKLNSEISSLAPSVPQNTSFDSSQIYSAPLNFTPPALPSEGSFPTVTAPMPSFQVFDNSSTGFSAIKQDYSNVSTGFQQFKSDVGSTFEYLGGVGQNFNTGFQMMKNDVSLAPVTSPDPGFLEAAAGAFGAGYDPRMPMFKSDYQNFYGNQAAESLKDGVTFAADAAASFALPAVGTALGMSAGAATAFIAAPLAILGGIGAYSAAVDESERQSGIAMQEMMLPTIKNASIEQGIGVARSIEAFASSDLAKTFDINMSDIQTTMASFASSGGYNNTITADQFTQKTREMLENFRMVVHALGMAQEEAAALMGELEAKKISSPANMGSFVAGLQVKAESVGVAPTDLLNMGFQSTELLRSYGYSPAEAFNFGIDASIEAQRLANSSDPYYKNAIYNIGGVGNATQSLMQNTTAYDNTALGGADTSYTYATGESPSGSVEEVLEQNAALFSDPNNYYKYSYNKRKVAQSIDFTGKSQNMLSKTLDIMKKYGLNTKDREVVTAFMSSFMKGQGVDMSIDEASLIIGAATNVEDPTEIANKVKAREAMNYMKETDPKFWNVIGTGIGNIFEGIGYGISEATRPIWKPLEKAGVGIYNIGDAFGDWFVNDLIEDGLISAVTKKKFFHHEDFRHMTADQFKLIGNTELFKRVGLMETNDDRYSYTNDDLNNIYSNIYDLGDREEKQLGKDKKSRIRSLANFEDSDIDNVLRFLPKVFGKDILKDKKAMNKKYNNKELDDLASDMSAIVDYIDDVMYETDTATNRKIKITDFKHVEDNLLFGKYLNDKGIFKSITEKADSEYEESSKFITENLSGFMYNYSYQDSAENLYNAVSRKVYGKSFRSLDDQKQIDLTRYLNTEGGKKATGRNDKFLNYEVLGILSEDENKKGVNIFDKMENIDTSTNEAYLAAKEDSEFGKQHFNYLYEYYSLQYAGRSNAKEQVEYSIAKAHEGYIKTPESKKYTVSMDGGYADVYGNVISRAFTPNFIISFEGKPIDASKYTVTQEQFDLFEAFKAGETLDPVISEKENENLMNLDLTSGSYPQKDFKAAKTPFEKLKIVREQVKGRVVVPEGQDEDSYLFSVALNSKNTLLHNMAVEAGKEVSVTKQKTNENSIKIDDSPFMKQASTEIASIYEKAGARYHEGNLMAATFSKIMANETGLDNPFEGEQGDDIKEVYDIMYEMDALARGGLNQEKIEKINTLRNKLNTYGDIGKQATKVVEKFTTYKGIDGSNQNLFTTTDLTITAAARKKIFGDNSLPEGVSDAFANALATEIEAATKEGRDVTIHGFDEAGMQDARNKGNVKFEKQGGIDAALKSSDPKVQQEAIKYMAQQQEQYIQSKTLTSEFWDAKGEANRREVVRAGIKKQNEEDVKAGKASAIMSEEELTKQTEALVAYLKDNVTKEAAKNFTATAWATVPADLTAVKIALEAIQKKI